MLARRSARLFSAATIACGLAACGSATFTRDTVTLDSPRLSDYEVRYEPMRDCLLKEMLPTRYAVTRPAYRLELAIAPGYNGQSPQIDALVSGPSRPTLEFPGLNIALKGNQTETGWTYTFDVSELPGPHLLIRVRGGGQALGEEEFQLRDRHCRGLGFGGPKPGAAR